MTAPGRHGGRPARRGGHPITRGVAAPLGPQVTTSTLPQLTENSPVPSGTLIRWVGGVAPFTIAETDAVPGVAVANTSATRTAAVTGTPTGDADDVLKVTVTDANGLVSLEASIAVPITPEVDAPPSSYVGYENRRIGFCMNQATPEMVKELGDIIAAGTDRLRGGKIRKDIGGVQMGGSANPTLANGGSADRALDAIAYTGAQCNAILGYSHRDDQRTLTFAGTTHAGNVVRWTGGLGSGLSSQAGVPGHQPTLPATGFIFGQMSVRGPGIAYVRGFTGSTNTTEPNKFSCTLPTGDSHGAGANFTGCGIKGPGIQNNTKITGPYAAGGFPLDKPVNATRSANAGYTIGRYVAGEDPGPFQCTLGEYDYSVAGETDLPLTGGVTAGKSGTYTVGGSNSNGDSKLPYANPVDAQRVSRAVMTQGGTRIGSGELWNEVAWPLGSRPFTDVPLLCRIFAHEYVGVKLAAKDQDRFIQVMFAGTGMINDASTRPQYFNARQWIDKCLDFYLNDDPDYFTDLLDANGLEKERASLFPADSLAMHPYGDAVMAPSNMGMNQCAYVFNTVGDALDGDYLPFCCVEQGLNWNRNGTGHSQVGEPVMNALTAYTRYGQWIDILHGNIPWPYNTRLQGPGAHTWKADGPADATHIPQADRRIAMRKCATCPEWFAIQEPANAHGPLGIGWSGGVRKYVPDTLDPVAKMADC